MFVGCFVKHLQKRFNSTEGSITYFVWASFNDLLLKNHILKAGCNIMFIIRLDENGQLKWYCSTDKNNLLVHNK